MKKALIIGANGFVGTHLANELNNSGYKCFGADISKFNNKDNFYEVYKINILDEENILCILKKVEPDYIINLAAISSVKASWDKPALTFDVNVKGTINLLEAIRKVGISPRILFIGSSEQYGKIDYSKPVKEEVELKSINPYGISKISQEKIVLMYKEAYGIDAILVRSFNHIGPGQGRGFVVPDFTSQIVDIEIGKKQPKLLVGDLSARRDFTDVRDVACAYRLLLEMGKCGEVYNVGSGNAVEIKTILNTLIRLSNVSVKVSVDNNKFRIIDTPIIVCDNSKLKKDTGWKQSIEIEKSLEEILEYHRKNNEL